MGFFDRLSQFTQSPFYAQNQEEVPEAIRRSATAQAMFRAAGMMNQAPSALTGLAAGMSGGQESYGQGIAGFLAERQAEEDRKREIAMQDMQSEFERSRIEALRAQQEAARQAAEREAAARAGRLGYVEEQGMPSWLADDPDTMADYYMRQTEPAEPLKMERWQTADGRWVYSDPSMPGQAIPFEGYNPAEPRDANGGMTAAQRFRIMKSGRDIVRVDVLTGETTVILEGKEDMDWFTQERILVGQVLDLMSESTRMNLERQGGTEAVLRHAREAVQSVFKGGAVDLNGDPVEAPDPNGREAARERLRRMGSGANPHAQQRNPAPPSGSQIGGVRTPPASQSTPSSGPAPTGRTATARKPPVEAQVNSVMSQLPESTRRKFRDQNALRASIAEDLESGLTPAQIAAQIVAEVGN